MQQKPLEKIPSYSIKIIQIMKIDMQNWVSIEPVVDKYWVANE